MSIQITGKNVDAGAAFQTYITNRIGEVLEKYVGPELSGHVRIEKERNTFRTHCHIQLRSGLIMQSNGEAPDAYASAEAALDRLEKRVRRHKRKLKNHHDRGNGNDELPALATDYVLQPGEDEQNEQTDAAPIIISETELPYRELAVSEAVMQLDLSDDPVLVFRNAAHGELNIVYRRSDGNIGWIDPREAEVGPVGGGRDACAAPSKVRSVSVMRHDLCIDRNQGQGWAGRTDVFYDGPYFQSWSEK